MDRIRRLLRAATDSDEKLRVALRAILADLGIIVQN